MTAKCILIIEDDEAIVRAWTRVLEGEAYVVLSAGSLADARELIAHVCTPLCPFHAVMLDLRLPDGDGAVLLPQLDGLRPRPRVAVVSANIDGTRAVALWGRCAVDVPKPLDARDLRVLIARLTGEQDAPHPADAFAVRHGLADCERRLLREAARGLSPAQCSATLRISPTSVATYWTRILKKTGCRSRTEVVALALGPDEGGSGT